MHRTHFFWSWHCRNKIHCQLILNRSYCIICVEVISSYGEACNGGILGPVVESLLFLMYIDDLANQLADPVLLFAGDVKLIYPLLDFESLKRNLFIFKAWSDLDADVTGSKLARVKCLCGSDLTFFQ